MIKIFKLGIKYVMPAIRVMLLNNRLHDRHISKNEESDIRSKAMLLATIPLLIIFLIPLFLLAELWHPIHKIYAYSLGSIILIIGYFFMRHLKNKRTIETTIEELNMLTKEECYSYRNSLIIKVFLWYFVPLIAMFIFFAIFQYFTK